MAFLLIWLLCFNCLHVKSFGADNGGPVIAMLGHGGFGNQVYQYLGLAASIRVARESNQINGSWECEFIFQDSSAGPADQKQNINLHGAYERFSWPHADCAAKESLSSVDNETMDNSKVSVVDLQRTDRKHRVLLITTKSCMFHSKGLCFIRGISTKKYWNALILLGSQVRLLDGDDRNREIRKVVGEKFLNESTICVHLRGKQYEHRQNNHSKVTSLIESVRLGIETYRQLQRAFPITAMTIITAMETKDVWQQSMRALPARDMDQLKSIGTVVMEGSRQLILRNVSILHELQTDEPESVLTPLEEGSTFDTADLVYLDLLRMTRCTWLVMAEPPGRGSFSGAAALWSGKHFCTSMQWLLCDPKVADTGNLSIITPWSDDHLDRFMSPPVFRAPRTSRW